MKGKVHRVIFLWLKEASNELVSIEVGRTLGNSN